MAKRTAGLGRGLSALLDEGPVLGPDREAAMADASGRPGVAAIAIADIHPHPNQPRRHFDEAALNELACSIEAHGVIQPIIVRKIDTGFELIAGERRWRAAQRARLHEIPAIVTDHGEAKTFELALIENIQREDLNAIEEAEAYRRLIAEFGHSQDALGALVHKSRSHIANLLRLLDLPESVRIAVAEGALSMGHARALITTADPEALAKDVQTRGLSVRETEKLAKGGRPDRLKQAPMEYKSRDADIGALERHVSDLLGLKVRIQHAGKTGTVTLAYASLEQLDLICQRLSDDRI